jgi:hypothetical protein
MIITKMTRANVASLVAKGLSGVNASGSRRDETGMLPRPRDSVAGSVYSGPQKLRVLWKCF